MVLDGKTIIVTGDSADKWTTEQAKKLQADSHRAGRRFLRRSRRTTAFKI